MNKTAQPTAPTEPTAARPQVDDPIGAVALLAEPTRRRLYELVASRGDAVGRDEAATSLGIGRELAAFHLDQLAAAGLVDVEFRRLTGRSGPGAGRPAKLYRRSNRELSVSLPQRDYERVAEVFADVLDRLGARDDDVAHAVGQTITDVARADGRRSGVAVRQLAGKRPGRSRLRSALVRALAAAGYEPRADRDARSIELQNCPFRALSTGHRNLTCGMNVAWAEGVVDGLGDARLEAEFTPRPGACCVTFKEVAPATSLVTRVR